MTKDSDNIENRNKESMSSELKEPERIETNKDLNDGSTITVDETDKSLENSDSDVNEHIASSNKNSTTDEEDIVQTNNDIKNLKSNLGEEINSSSEVNTSNSKIKKQLVANEVGVVGNVVNNYFNLEENTDEKFEDPTHPFPKEISGFNNLVFEKEIQNKYNQLKKETVLIINGLDSDGNLKIAKEFVLLAEKESYECRVLTFEGFNSQSPDLHLETFIKNKIGSNSKVLIVVNVTVQTFLNTLMCNDKITISIIKEGLQAQNTIVLCLVSIKDYYVQLNNIKNTFCIWKISFLETILLPGFGEESFDIKNKILDQRKRGLWDTVKDENDESELYIHISTYLNQGIQKLREEIEIREKNIKISSAEFYKKVKKIEAKELFNQADELRRIILYIATFFENLTPHEFEKILQLLIKEKEHEVEVEKSKISKKGKRVKKLVYENQKLFVVWKKSSDQLLNECMLKAIQDNEGLWLIGFKEPFLRDNMKNYLESERPMFIVNQYQEFQEQGFLFEPSLSERIFKNIIQVSVRMILTNPSHFGVNWLFSVLLNMQNLLSIEKREIHDEEELFSLLIEEIKKKELKNHFYYRLTELIREILKYPKLHHVIKEFLLILINKKHFGITLEIISEILQRIGVISEINLFFYLKRIVEEGDNENKEKVSRFLYSYTFSNRTRFYDVIELIKDWFPTESIASDKYGSANKCALKFLIYYLINSSIHFKPKEYGKWPTNFQLFHNLRKSETEKRYFIFIINILFNTGIKEVVSEERLKVSLNEVVKEYGYNNDIAIASEFIKVLIEKDYFIIVTLADLIERWMWILLGLTMGKTHKEAQNTINFILTNILENTEIDTKQYIQYWQEKKMIYIDSVDLNHSTKNDRLIIKQKREILNQLIKRFKSTKN